MPTKGYERNRTNRTNANEKGEINWGSYCPYKTEKLNISRKFKGRTRKKIEKKQKDN